MTWLLDTSLVLHLAKCGLLDAASTNLIDDESDILVPTYEFRQILDSPKSPKTKRRRAAEHRHGKEVVEEVECFLERCKATGAPRDNSEHVLLRQIDSIDPGEMFLFCATKDLDEFALGIDDFRSLHALAKIDGAEEVRNRMQNNVITSFHVLRDLIEISPNNYDQVKNGIVQASDRTSFFSRILEDGGSASKKQMLLRLNRCIDEKRLNTGDLLAP